MIIEFYKCSFKKIHNPRLCHPRECGDPPLHRFDQCLRIRGVKRPEIDELDTHPRLLEHFRSFLGFSHASAGTDDGQVAKCNADNHQGATKISPVEIIVK